MYRLRRLLFQARLCIALMPFLTQLAILKARTRKSFLLSSVFFLTIATILSIAGIALLIESQMAYLKPTTPPENTADVVAAPSYLTRSEIEAALEQNRQAAKLYPTHRDILLNTSLLYDALGESSRAEHYWEAARERDPNHPIFY